MAMAQLTPTGGCSPTPTIKSLQSPPSKKHCLKRSPVLASHAGSFCPNNSASDTTRWTIPLDPFGRCFHPNPSPVHVHDAPSTSTAPHQGFATRIEWDGSRCAAGSAGRQSGSAGRQSGKSWNIPEVSVGVSFQIFKGDSRCSVFLGNCCGSL